ncbi:hypothetical protein QFZ68_007315 [Streptomyces sp. V1I6]|nr:hypothetical protein [Streptomyces sp. V1I6]
MTARHLTSAEHRRVEWKVLDRAMARFSTDSLIVLFQAALVSPGSARFHDHVLLLFTRALRTSAHGGILAGAADLPELVEAAVRAAPGRGVVTERDPAEVRDRVRFSVAEDHLLVHPGQLAHPLLVLRSLKLTAGAVDKPLREALGFGVEDVLELVLRLTNRSLAAFSAAWPAPETGPAGEEGPEVSCRVTPAEVSAAAAVARADPAELVPAARFPERAERALQWLTCRIEDLPLRYHPDVPLLGPVLALPGSRRSRVRPGLPDAGGQVACRLRESGWAPRCCAPCPCGWRSGSRLRNHSWHSTPSQMVPDGSRRVRLGRQHHEGPGPGPANSTRGTRMATITCSNAGASPAWPRVSTKHKG